MLRPTAVALSRITGRGDYIDAQLAISLQPELVTGSELAGKPLPLPPLGHHYPRSAGLNMHLGINLDFTTLNQRLSSTFADKFFVIKNHRLVLKNSSWAAADRKSAPG